MFAKFLSIITVPLSFVIAPFLYILLTRYSLHNSHQLYFAVGFGLSAILTLFFVKVNSFFVVFHHECCHLLWSLISFRKPKHFKVESSGRGEVAFSGSGNLMIILSPYFFPLYALLFVPLIELGFNSDWVYALFGAAAAWSFVVQIRQATPHQTDIKHYGAIFSYPLLLFFQSLVLIMLISYVEGGSSNVAQELLAICNSIENYAVSCFDKIF